ncbi:MAG TPA: TlyA family RNA methyltransferase [Pseudogracilibacillus sp.]|nr:TlyA family RNA methyltransferase [Pseudogracilibacillus sp.]
MTKERLDVLLVNRNLIDTREKAKRMIMAGLVFSQNERMDKPGMKVKIDIPLHIKGRPPYVSRGGLKLEKALHTFDVSVKNKTIVDVGASTGGFTDCALQNGATYVYAVDVGYNQLAWKIRNHPQVEVHERTNFRYVTETLFQNGQPNFAMMDVSFISIRHILPILNKVVQSNSDLVSLIKPQFEAKREEVGKKGIIRDMAIHKKVIKDILHIATESGFSSKELTFSPITGGEGNIEFLAHFQQSEAPYVGLSDEQINEVIKEAHDSFQKK